MSLYLLLTLISLSQCRHLEVMFVSYGSLAPNGPATLSRSLTAYQLAVEDLNQEVSNQSINFTLEYVPAKGCLKSLHDGNDVLASWFYKLQRPDRVIVFATPGMEPDCNINDQSMSLMAAYWNTLSLSTMFGLDVNRIVLPTTLSLAAGSSSAYVTLCLNLLNKYSWTSVNVIAENIAGTINTLLSVSLVSELAKTGKYVVNFRQITANPNTTFRSELTEFRAVSRVMFVLVRVRTLRRLLITASSMNMTNGDYVYITMEAFKPKEYGVMTWFQNDTEEAVARDAFNSLLVLQKVRENVEFSVDLMKLDRKFRQRSLDTWNVTFNVEGDPSLSFMANADDAIKVAARVINETWRDSPEMVFNGKYLADRMVNRTFITLYGAVYVDSDGTRMEPLALTHFNGERERFLMQYADTMDRLDEVGPMIGWPGSSSRWPPPNEPFCGYDGRKSCADVSADYVKIAAGTGAFALVVLVCLCMVIRNLTWQRSRNADMTNVWWTLENDQLADRCRSRSRQLAKTSTLYRTNMSLNIGSAFGWVIY